MPHSAASSLGPAYGLEVGVKGALRRAAKGAPPALDPGFKPVMPVAPIRNSKEATFLMGSPPSRLRPALFLDRDGVINVEKNYVHRIEDFEFLDGIFDLCRAATQRHMLIVVVTNQAGIGRGYYSEAQFLTLTDWMQARFEEEKAPIAAVYFCPYHPEHGVGEYRKESFDRKPNPGMLLRARDELGLDLACSILIGDKATDIAAAKAAGVGLTVLLGADVENARPDRVVTSLHEACELLFSWQLA